MISSNDRFLFWPMLAALAAAGCGVVRSSDHEKVCPSYEATIRPVVEARCGSCHGAQTARGGYQVGPHASTVSRSDDGTPRVAPGEASSPFLEAARGKLKGHSAIPADDTALLENWVLRCRGAPRAYDYHPIGWATSTDPLQFHGGAVRDGGYEFTDCKSCHGDDLRGGKSGFDCSSCHQGENGPLACDTCHGDKRSAAPPKSLSGVRLTTSLGVGAHRAHVEDGKLHKGYGCGTCHNDIKKVDDEGHYRRGGKFFAGPATVRLPSTDGGTAKWDRTTATCTNVACHEPNKADTAATKFAPVWTRVGNDALKCGGCHGNPPSSHSDNRCEVCHSPAYEGGGVDLALHLNGKVDLRGGGEKCDSCHAGPDATRFVDLRGNTDAGVQTVGAHDAHLRANKLRGPMTCNDCHRVPLKLDSPGHIDDAPPATVFPPGLGGLASAQGAMPVYNAANATCGSVYCHGGGVFPFVDTAPGLLRTPKWTGGPDQAACGTCHGLPPIDGSLGHTLAQTQPCVQCHSGTVNADGGLVFTVTADGGRTTKHMDGKITGQ